VLCFCLCIVVSNTYCVVFLFVYSNTELTSALTNSVILLDVHNALRILFPNYYTLVNEVAKGYGNAGFSVVFMNRVMPIHQVVSEKKMKM
jgi:hypothetical protein